MSNEQQNYRLTSLKQITNKSIGNIVLAKIISDSFQNKLTHQFPVSNTIPYFLVIMNCAVSYCQSNVCLLINLSLNVNAYRLFNRNNNDSI